jgi:enoyl-CoA hydratase/carnithine racemase
MMVTGGSMSFEEAQAIGLVNQVLEAGEFDAAVQRYARQFCPPHKASMAVGRIKRAVVTGAEMPFAEALALERELQQQLFTSNDAREGLEAYLAKRPPRFEGR